MKARLVISSLFLLGSVTLRAGWYVDTSAASAHLGGPPQFGPFSTRTEAEAFVSANAGFAKIIEGGFDDASSPPPIVRDLEAERKAAEAAEQDRKQKEFDDTQRKLADSLKEVRPASPKKPAPTIKDKNSGGFGFKGIGDTGIKDVRPDKDVRDLGGRNAAWKQLNAAVYLMGKSTATEDRAEAVYLADQAFRAANGEPLGVAVPAAPPMPAWSPGKLAPPQYLPARQGLSAQLSQATQVVYEQQKKLAEASKVKTKAATERKAAQEKVAQLQPPSTLTAVVTNNGAASAPVAEKTNGDAMAAALAALAAAEQAEIDATRAEESADAEVMAGQGKVNDTLRSYKDLEANPALAPDILTKLQSASPAQPPSP